MEQLAARYELLVDNLLDLSHETYLHGGYIGTPEVADAPISTEIDQEQRVIRVSRRMDAAACPPFYARSTGLSLSPAEQAAADTMMICVSRSLTPRLVLDI
jgi:phenylpropionate dioxygenase-like ring-hydroxylating dioxygenase large terminal subunit